MEKVVTISTPKDKLKAALDTLREGLPFMIEMHRIQAKLKREVFLSFINEGFNEHQALELTKQVTP